MDKATTDHIKFLADKYETEAFLASDPSQFMHKVSGDANQETMAFIASCSAKYAQMASTASMPVEAFLFTYAFSDPCSLIRLARVQNVVCMSWKV